MIILFLIIFLVGFIYTKFILKLPEGVLTCGLSGYSGKKNVDKRDMALLIWDNEVRGDHSTGVYSKKSGLIKKAESASKFLRNIDLKLLEDKIVISHTRYATMGFRSESNAHPYKYGRFVGAHNGWLINNSKRNELNNICEKFGYKKKDFDVDSQLIFHHINEKNDLKAISDIEGSMALSIVEIDEKTGEECLWLYRRESKPLYYFQDNGSLFYSSRKEGLDYLIPSKSDISIQLLPPNKLFKIINGTLSEQIDVDEPEINILIDETPSEFNLRFCGINSSSQKHWTEKEEPPKKKEKEVDGNIINISNLPAGERSSFSCLTSLGYWGSSIEQLERVGYKNLSASIKSSIQSPLESNDSLVVIKLSSAETKEELEGWQVKIDGFPTTACPTLAGGIAAMVVPKKAKFSKKGKCSLKIMITPPVNEVIMIDECNYLPRFFYSTYEFNVNKGKMTEINILVYSSITEIPVREDFHSYYIGSKLDKFSKFTRRPNVLENPTFYKREYKSSSNWAGNSYYNRENFRSVRNSRQDDDEEQIFNTPKMNVNESSAYLFGDGSISEAWGNGKLHKANRTDVEISMDAFHSETLLDELESGIKCVKNAASAGEKILPRVDNIDAINQAYADFFLAVKEVVQFKNTFELKCIDNWSQFEFSKTNSPSKIEKIRCKKAAMLQAMFDCESILDYINEYKITINLNLH